MIRKKVLLDEIDVLYTQTYYHEGLIRELEERINDLEAMIKVPAKKDDKLEKAIKAVTKTEKKKPGRPRKVNK